MCGHVHNSDFDPELTEYSGRYESTQSFSATFNAFHRSQANDLIDRFDLRGKEIIEIGCGNGEFLVLLCEEGDNIGLGFDPAHLPGRVPIKDTSNIEFVTDFYSEAYGDRSADFVTCKMTLEHIIDTGRFIRNVRSAIGDRLETTVCFQVPNGRYVLGDLAFWDVYYEHCSYFTPGSLARLFRQERFDVFDIWTEYDDQYLTIAARPTTGPTMARLDAEDDLDDVRADVDRFANEVPQLVESWRAFLAKERAEGRRVALWGGGSKGVAFLTTLGVGDEVGVVVDINPNKAGTYMAGTGHQIVSPDALVDVRPDTIVLMNPVYFSEVQNELAARGLEPRIVTIE